MNSQIERYKIQIDSLNEKVSFQECENVNLRARKDDELADIDQRKLKQSLDYQENINK